MKLTCWISDTCEPMTQVMTDSYDCISKRSSSTQTQLNKRLVFPLLLFFIADRVVVIRHYKATFSSPPTFDTLGAPTLECPAPGLGSSGLERLH